MDAQVSSSWNSAMTDGSESKDLEKLRNGSWLRSSQGSNNNNNNNNNKTKQTDNKNDEGPTGEDGETVGTSPTTRLSYTASNTSHISLEEDNDDDEISQLTENRRNSLLDDSNNDAAAAMKSCNHGEGKEDVKIGPASAGGQRKEDHYLDDSSRDDSTYKQQPSTNTRGSHLGAALVVQEGEKRTFTSITMEELQLLRTLRHYRKHPKEIAKLPPLIKDSFSDEDETSGEIGRIWSQTKILLKTPLAQDLSEGDSSLAAILQEEELVRAKRKTGEPTAGAIQRQRRAPVTDKAPLPHQDSDQAPGAYATGSAIDDSIESTFEDRAPSSYRHDTTNSIKDSYKSQQQLDLEEQVVAECVRASQSDNRDDGFDDDSVSITAMITSDTPIEASIVPHTEPAVQAAILSHRDVQELVKPGFRRRLFLVLAALICAIIAIVVGVTVAVTIKKRSPDHVCTDPNTHH